MKHKKINLLTLTAVLVIGMTGCSNDDDVQIENPAEERVEVYNDFNGRITYHNEPLEAYDDGSGKMANSSGFTYVADISAPVLHGKTMSATGIAVQGNKAYVSYHRNENEGDYAGAIEVIDISQPGQPSLISGLYFMDTDLNELDVQGNEVYAVGGRSLSASGYDANFTSGGVVEVVRLQGGLLTNQVDEAPIPSFSGNSVFRKGNELYCASGNTGGGVFELDLKKNNYLNVTNSDYYDNSKYGVNEGSIYAFLRGGANSELHIHNSNNFNPGSKTVIPLSSPTAPEDGKKVLKVDFPNNVAYVSSGSYGLHAYDVNDPSGTALQSFTTSGNALVNGVDYDHNYVYAAKGSEGLYILDKNTMTNIAANFNFTGSANYVKSSPQNVFIAHGRGGLKILSK